MAHQFLFDLLAWLDSFEILNFVFLEPLGYGTLVKRDVGAILLILLDDLQDRSAGVGLA